MFLHEHIFGGVGRKRERSGTNERSSSKRQRGRDSSTSANSSNDVKYYTVKGFLGSGAYGTVYKVLGKDGKFYTMKQIYAPNAKHKQMILNEIYILYYLSHFCQACIKFVDAFYENDYYFIIMTYLKNYIDLKTFLEKNLRSYDNLIIIKNLYDSLTELHNLNVSHVDIKPSNIMVNPSNLKIKIIDFGLSCITSLVDIPYKDKLHPDQNVLRNTVNSVVKPTQPCRGGGSPAYMSWTLRFSHYRTNDVFFKNDVWAFGITSFEIYKGRRPEKIIPSSVMQNITQKEIDEYITKKIVNNPMLANIIILCLQINMNKRTTLRQLRPYFEDPLYNEMLEYESDSESFSRRQETNTDDITTMSPPARHDPTIYISSSSSSSSSETQPDSLAQPSQLVSLRPPSFML